MGNHVDFATRIDHHPKISTTAPQCPEPKGWANWQLLSYKAYRVCPLFFVGVRTLLCCNSVPEETHHTTMDRSHLGAYLSDGVSDISSYGERSPRKLVTAYDDDTFLSREQVE